ncbi:bifunctional 2-polyprenyl-6-hydroxyphenol methylase/3-demethylubiquinol 3-O-methyltransferase UbiG [Acetobacter oryzoeni]|uniref:Ubiquinone biosynthesis O-methyltransferase n=1 Tax=Acetobacter oryzoeni TaxID=2500548 RepID=A0A5B9GLJ8_9PROT|nr:bifunctional 2-polyprenyl-6-hydroxyphenol methylase/3-demethylubiquinol 3-O-methyltransferase UbiG [Acetobacter oryzoeni]MCP1201311.1 bifunctional 2-polyprenyl-6-hydroxyphenol methylase/3-demethylubiquinol 3-O-methyltransferase UbiG [Acetobacter oryzoeni]QEE85160.1 bifunctional 2-polyprenyl-6-hydroxyphenol methylase/3-demethylubiquinol 3-O-methyltransferase UbiG [Acetobacter oryzoeni]
MHATREEAPSSVSSEEIARFSALADKWWDPTGPMRPLHAMNGLRIEWASRHLPLRGRKSRKPHVLDIGCGAGLASEALAKAGYDVLGLDASANGIAAAQAHLEANPLPAGSGTLHYRQGSAEELVAEHAKFDAVMALEIIEHVTDPEAFMIMLAQLVDANGTVIVSTMNRTLRSLAVGKIGAEYLLRLLPVGTHEWRKFIQPSELGRYARTAGLRMVAISGMAPGIGSWKETRDLGINYIAAFKKD